MILDDRFLKNLNVSLSRLGEDGTHFEGTIVSGLFEGLNRVKQHQMVFNVLGDKMKSEIHALSMKTYTPNEWNQLKT